MSAVPDPYRGAEPERRVERGARPRPRAVPKPRRRRARLRLGTLVIPLIATMLAGIVWVNVAKLGLSTQTSTTVQKARQVQAETVQLRARLERLDSEVVDRARRRGFEDPSPDAVTYLDLTP